MSSITHFGIVLRESKYGFYLNENNYAIINKRNSFGKNVEYTDEWCQEHYADCMKNYAINMERFNNLNPIDFNNNLDTFLLNNPCFENVSDLNVYDNKPGYYLMILDKYKQVYIGNTNNIKNRIIQHWQKVKEFDRLIFGSVETSIISIDSFRALDTTRIYVYQTNELYNFEDKFLNQISPEYCLNRTVGGKLNSELEAIRNRKTMAESLNNMYFDKINGNQDEMYTIIDIMKILKCSRNKVINLYVYNGLPLQKHGNKYVISADMFWTWYDIKKQEAEEKSYKISIVIAILMGILVGILLIIYIVVIVNVSQKYK